MLDTSVVWVLVIGACLNSVAGDANGCNLPDSKVKNFDFSKFQGLWHLVSSNYEKLSKEGRCWDDTFKKDGVSLDGVSLESQYKTPDGKNKESIGTLKFHGNNPAYKQQYEDPDTKDYSGEFVIFATDYTNYAVIAGCTAAKKNLYYVQYRERESNNKQQTPDAVKEALKSVGMDVNKFIPNCGTS